MICYKEINEERGLKSTLSDTTVVDFKTCFHVTELFALFSCYSKALMKIETFCMHTCYNPDLDLWEAQFPRGLQQVSRIANHLIWIFLLFWQRILTWLYWFFFIWLKYKWTSNGIFIRIKTNWIDVIYDLVMVNAM